MTSKIYKTAQGKSIDLGTILLQNEHVRAVGNMKVNARGDKLDSMNKVIETKSKQIQRQNTRTTNVSSAPVHTSALKTKREKESAQIQDTDLDVPDKNYQNEELETPQVETNSTIPSGGLAAAIARSREVKQELEKTMRQRAQEQKLRKI